MNIEILLISLILIHIILNIVFTFAVLNRSLFSLFQRSLYISVIWLIPIFGLIWMWIILNYKQEKAEVDDSGIPYFNNTLSGDSSTNRDIDCD